MEVSGNSKTPTKDSHIQKKSDTGMETAVNASKKPAAISDKISTSVSHIDDVKGEDLKTDVMKNADALIETSTKENQEEENEQDNKLKKNEDDEHEKDPKVQKPVTEDTMAVETQSLEKRFSSLIARREHKSNGEEKYSDQKEGKRKRRNPSTHSRESLSGEDGGETKRKRSRSGSDKFCWRCHKEAVEAQCSACPRSWHRKCMGGTPQMSPQNWICGECATILRAENAETRSAAMAQLSVDQLCTLLKHVVGRMRDTPGSEPFWKPVDLAEVPNYLDFVVKPMDLGLLESNVRAKLYGSTEAFMADAKWIQHNCIVFNTCGGVYADTSKLTNAARQVIKMARQEVSEIEACPDCYSHARNLPRSHPSWFIEPCRRPHPLVWAKLKGFPFWPAKAMPRLNGQGHVDVRFFGAHDRAWVPPRDLYLYSEDPPTPPRRKRKLDLEECVREITRHCRKLELAFGQFRFAPPKIQYNPQDPMQIKLMLPNYDPLHPNNVLSLQNISPRRKSTLRKRVPPSRKKSQARDSPNNAASDSANDSSIPRRESGDDCEKYIEANRIPKSANSPASKISLPLLPDKRNHNLNVMNDEDKSKRGNNSPNSQNSDRDKNATSMGKSNNVRLKRSEDPLINNVNATKENGTEQNSRSIERPSVKRKCTIKEKPPGASLLKSASFDDLNTHSTEMVEETESDSNSSRSKGISPAQDDLSSPKTSSRTNRSQVRVYKPKTRMVNQVIAERAKESASNKQQQDIERIETSKLKPKETTITATTTATTRINNVSTTTVIITKPVNSTTVATTVSKPATVATTNLLVSAASNNTFPITTISNTSTAQTIEQPMAFFLLVNNGIPDVAKKSQQIEDSRTTHDTLAIIKQEPKEHHHQPQQKKESKARKSFPNKPPSFPQISQAHPAPPKAPASPPDAMVYIPGNRNENASTYHLLPPEAGPLSAQLHRGGKELATRMSQLIEEALKEAAKGNDNSQNITSDNHQATIHFLRLQIERMRWQHQQQLAELKHNTDLTMREMRASLEAERQRAVEETKREAEEERIRSVEETKRKQWCALCGNEALFYCCWNTAYCDYPCQQAHWPTHMRTCAQNPPPNAITTTTANNQQQNGPAKTCGPASRVYALQNGAYRVVPTSSPCPPHAPPIKAIKIHQP